MLVNILKCIMQYEFIKTQIWIINIPFSIKTHFFVIIFWRLDGTRVTIDMGHKRIFCSVHSTASICAVYPDFWGCPDTCTSGSPHGRQTRIEANSSLRFLIPHIFKDIKQRWPNLNKNNYFHILKVKNTHFFVCLL